MTKTLGVSRTTHTPISAASGTVAIWTGNYRYCYVDIAVSGGTCDIAIDSAIGDSDAEDTGYNEIEDSAVTGQSGYAYDIDVTGYDWVRVSVENNTGTVTVTSRLAVEEIGGGG